MDTGKKYRIGFVGQGWIGKNYADNFEARGFKTVRYGLEVEYSANKEQIASCDVVFIAVPTPTTPQGQDSSIVEEGLSLVGKGKIAVIKSTILPGTTEGFQEKFPEIIVLHSPEFLTKSTAVEDVAFPKSNTVGMSQDSDSQRAAARLVLSILPSAPFSQIVKSSESELLKYVTNGFYYTKTVYMNMMYNLCQSLGCDWQPIREALGANPWIGNQHLDPVHKSGRGAGGPCLIKDFAAFKSFFEGVLPADSQSRDIFDSVEKKNLSLLKGSGKDTEIINGVYEIKK